MQINELPGIMLYTPCCNLFANSHQAKLLISFTEAGV
jgi:hypothetical protein